MNLNCPECSTKEIRNEGDGIMSCLKCNTVFDSGPQWAKYNPSANNQMIGKVENKSGINAKTVLKWQKETRTGNLTSRSILLAAEEIERIATVIKLKNEMRESALEIFSSASKAGIVRGRSSEKVAAAAIYTACRMANVPRTLDEVANYSSINRNELSRLHKLIVRKLKLSAKRTNLQYLLERFSSKLELNDVITKAAKEIIVIIEKSDYRQGISPAALLGASLYISCKKNGTRRSQLEIANTVGTSEVTLRNRSKEISTILNSR